MSTTAIALFVDDQDFWVKFRGIKSTATIKTNLGQTPTPMDSFHTFVSTYPGLRPFLKSCSFYMATNPGLTLIKEDTQWNFDELKGDAWFTILFIPKNGKEITCKDE
eukprot:GHVU01229640.1.p1 GENE.GHVU01229640.1~~GHVU01229640.1.p1  ORF type:complete len:107 (+),score=3.72 GHVU01229640.1:795-1115(+)